MAEPNVTSVAEPVVNPNPSPPAGEPAPILSTPISIVKPDLTFVEGWQDKLPEEIKGEECWKLVKDFPEMARQFVNQRKAIGKNKVALPDEKSKPQDWEAFYTAIGRPVKVEDYKGPAVPEDLKEIFDDNRIGALKKTAFELGATQKQFDAYLKNEIEQVKTLLAEEDKRDLQAKQDAEKALRTEFGGAYEERIHVANRLIAEAFSKEEDKMNFLEKFGSDPDFIRFASRVGAKMGEHSALIAQLTQKTTGEVQKRIAELNATPGYMSLDDKMSKEQREAITAELRELNLQLHPAQKAG